MKKIIVVAVPLIIFTVMFVYFYLGTRDSSQLEAGPSVAQAPVVTPTDEIVISQDAAEFQQPGRTKEAPAEIGVSLSDVEKQELIDRVLQKISILSDEEKKSLATGLVVRMHEDPEIPLSDEEEVLMNELSKNLGGKPISDVEIKYTIIQEVNGKVQGILVPPAPDKVANDTTLAGIDTNANGIRDDVERFIAQKFGSNKALYPLAVTHARTLQAAIINISKYTPAERSKMLDDALVQAHLDSFRCIGDNDILDQLSMVTEATLNTNVRGAAYGDAFAGAFIGSEGCPAI